MMFSKDDSEYSVTLINNRDSGVRQENTITSVYPSLHDREDELYISRGQYLYNTTEYIEACNELWSSAFNLALAVWNNYLVDNANVSMGNLGFSKMFSSYQLSAAKYTVTYNANGGSVSPTSSSVESDSSVTLPTPARNGYTCLGWAAKSTAASAAYKCGALFNPTANTTLYAVWTPNIYKVTLDNSGASSAGTAAYWYKYNTAENGVYYYLNDSCTTAMKGSSITCPQKTGYVFKGYYSGKNGTGTQYVNASGACINNLYKNMNNQTLYAAWEEVSAKPGDVNNDGLINSSDALIVLQHSVGKVTLSGNAKTAADTDKNGQINSSDALRILQYSVGQITAF